MRRFTVAGLVPCPPGDLADAFLDFPGTGRIWPGLGERRVLRFGDGWWECEPAGRVSAAAPVRYRRTTAEEVTVSAPGGGVTLHRFLPAEGGCLWTVESHAQPRRGESWARFSRRRRDERDAVEAMVDSAAAYFAALHE